MLHPQELENLAVIREVVNTANSPGWSKIIGQMEKFVDEAYEEMVGNTSSDPMTYMHRQLRWQQREAMLRGVKQYVAACENERKVILDSVTPQQSVPLEDQGGIENVFQMQDH